MKTPEARRQIASMRVGLVVLALTAVALWLTFKSQTGWPLAPTTEVKAAFGNVHSLKVNDDVRQDSKRIGRVSAVEYDDGKAIVTMELKGHRDVYADASALLWDQSALATKFVELDPGDAKTGPLGGKVIGKARTADSHDLYQLLDVFDDKTRASAGEYLRNAGGGFAGHGADLHELLDRSPEILDDAGEISAALASPEADLPGLLRTAERLSGRFEGRTDEIAQLVDQSATTLRALSVDEGRPLAEAIEGAPGTLRDARQALVQIDEPLADTQVAMRNLRSGGRDLGAATPDLRAVLRAGSRVAPKMPPVFEHAEPVVEDLTRTVHDAQPLGPRLAKAVTNAATPLRVLAPYAPEIATWAVRGQSFLSQGPAPGIRFARLAVVPGVDTVTGGLIGSSNFAQNEYPAPGQADRDRTTGGLPSGVPIGGAR